MNIINGNKIKDEILSNIKKEIESLSFVPVFCDVLVGDDFVSASYVRMKKKLAESVGIQFYTSVLEESINTEELILEIQKLNKIPNMCGIIVQLPLPPHIDKVKVLDAIDPNFDVDCLGSIMSNKFYNNQTNLSYPTALACIHILDSLNLDLKDKNIVVLGQGMLVGRPVTHMLESRGYKVNKIKKDTENIKDLLQNADVIISAIGQGKFIKGDMIKSGAVVIDAGTSEEDGGVIGDVDFESVKEVASYISPTPGGVGPVTVAMLLNNVLQVAKDL
jgi:methylenetetrahydrofolate dehydrogenase (NADP+) / methenyltetrahydrofolate cyclohydrolase